MINGKMPHKLSERQHQLQAQRRHAENQRQDYYQRTARYFERESEAAKQFTSWTTRSLDSYNEWLVKKRKEEKLSERREKLKKLFEEEDECYKKELEEKNKKRRNRRSADAVSLDEVKRLMIQKKAEQSLYYPSSCRRVSRSCGGSSADNSRCMQSIDLSDGRSIAGRPSSGDSQKQTRFSTGTLSDKASPKYHPVNNTEITQAMNQLSLTPKSPSSGNLRYAARRSVPSLSNTNIRGNDDTDGSNASSRSSKEQDLALEEKERNGSRAESCDVDEVAIGSDRHTEIDRVTDYNDVVVQETVNRSLAPTASQSSVSVQSQAPSRVAPDLQCEPYEFESADYETNVSNNRHPERNQLSLDNPIGDSKLNFKNKDHRQGDEESMQYYRFLKHQDLKAKILDLCKREHVYVVKQSWDEALRLREMRNELILLKNKNLYENHDLDIDEEIRKSALKIVEAREALHKRREKMCNSMVYSDEAKDLWKQWVKEDDNLAKIETNATRDLFLNKIEEDWENLAMRDKQRMSELYDRVMNHSELQDEHKLAAAFREANERQKKYSTYFEG